MLLVLKELIIQWEKWIITRQLNHSHSSYERGKYKQWKQKGRVSNHGLQSGKTSYRRVIPKLSYEDYNIISQAQSSKKAFYAE